MNAERAAIANDERFSLAKLSHLRYFVGLMIADGSLCPKCGHGARHTSKNWARCKRASCQHRFRRLLDVTAETRQKRGVR